MADAPLTSKEKVSVTTCGECGPRVDASDYYDCRDQYNKAMAEIERLRARFEFLWERVKSGKPILTVIDPYSHIAVRTEAERLAFLDAYIAGQRLGVETAGELVKEGGRWHHSNCCIFDPMPKCTCGANREQK